MLIFLPSRTDIDERHTAVKPLASRLFEAQRRSGVRSSAQVLPVSAAPARRTAHSARSRVVLGRTRTRCRDRGQDARSTVSTRFPTRGGPLRLYRPQVL